MNIYSEKIAEYLTGYGRLFVCHRFISDSPWDSLAVMDTVAEKVYDSLTVKRSELAGPSNDGLILDESGWEKSGKKSVGVAHQYIGQVGVFASLCNGEQVGLLQGRFYLPQEWVADKVRCTKAGIPASEQVYRTKPELAVEILKSLPARVSYEWVGGDSIYGNSPVVRQHLYAKQQAFVLDVGEELSRYLEPAQPYVPAKKSGARTDPHRLCLRPETAFAQASTHTNPRRTMADHYSSTRHKGSLNPKSRNFGRFALEARTRDYD